MISRLREHAGLTFEVVAKFAAKPLDDDFGLDKVFAFAPEAAAAPAAAAYTPPAVDMSAYVAVSPTYKHLLYDDIAVGHWVDEEMEAAGQKHKTRTAVVAETDDHWIIEVDNQMNQKDLLVAVFVNKETGETQKAYTRAVTEITAAQ